MSESAVDQVNKLPDTMQAVICHGPENYPDARVRPVADGPDLHSPGCVGVREAARTALEIRDAAAAEARPLRERFLREAGEHPIAAQLTAKALGLEPHESKTKSASPSWPPKRVELKN